MNSTGHIGHITSIIPPKEDHFEKRIQALHNEIRHTPNENNLIFIQKMVEAQQQAFLILKNKPMYFNEKAPFFVSIVDNEDEVDTVKQSLLLILNSFKQKMESSLTHITHRGSSLIIHEVIDSLESLSHTKLNRYLSDIFALNFKEIPAEYRFFLNAALHAYLYTKATQFVAPEPYLLTQKDVCPCCTMPPIASLLEGINGGLRYLSCSFCETKWHVVRGQCTACMNNKYLEQISLEDGTFMMKAETCNECKVYIHSLDRTKDDKADVYIEGLLGLALDIALAQEGYKTYAVNPYLS